MKLTNDNIALFGMKMIADMLTFKAAAEMVKPDMTTEHRDAIVDKLQSVITAVRECMRHLDASPAVYAQDQSTLLKQYETALKDLATVEGNSNSTTDSMAARVRARAKRGLEPV